MKTKQAKTLPVGVVVSRGRSGHELTRGQVLKNSSEFGCGFIVVKWNGGEEERIPHQCAKNIFVPGLRGTRTA